MTWPLIERELRAATRKRHLRKMRTWGTVLCAAIAALFLLAAGNSGSRDWGRSLNTLLFWGGLIIILQVPSYTVGVFTEERRNQTLGLLFLCGISPVELFLSKTLGSALVSFSRLMILYPFLAISFLGGGLSIEGFIASICSLPVLLFFVFSVCVLASVLCEEESTAMFVAMLLAGVMCVTPLLINLIGGGLSNPNSLAHELLMFSPALPCYLALGRVNTGNIGEFWAASAVSVLLSVLMLFVAGLILSRVWQDKPGLIVEGSFRARFRDWFHGDAAWRKKLSHRWNDMNPFVWLALRDRQPVTLAWIVIGGIVLSWLVGCVCWPQAWICPANFFLTAIAMNLSLSWLSTFAAAKTIGHSRSSGELELLLTTPLTHLDIIRGQMVALREQFRPIACMVLALDVIMFITGIVMRRWSEGAMLVYVIFWALVLGWTVATMMSYRRTIPVFWDSLVCGRPAYVALKKTGMLMSPQWLVYYIFILGNVIRGVLNGGIGSFPTGSLNEQMCWAVVLIVMFWTGALAKTALQKTETRLATDFRAVAAKPVPEPSDPRYKHWKSGEHFPEMFSDVLVGRIIRHMKNEPTKTGTSQMQK